MSDNFKVFVTLFDSNGVESIVDLTEIEEDFVLEKLSADADDAIQSKTRSSANTVIHMLELRARFNGQRNAECFGFRSDLDIDDLWDFATTSPQSFADWMRANGHPIYSHYKHDANPKII